MFTLDSFKSAVENKKEIREVVKEDYIVFDYMISLKDTFDSIESRNARGIAFSPVTKKIISLPYDKFHNLNECPGWMEADINMADPHVVLEKLDGSMIRTIDMGGGWYRLGTRAGITDVSIKAENYLESCTEKCQDNYFKFIMNVIQTGYTAIFEYCAPDNQIVIYYDQPQLILTGVRCNETGTYHEYGPTLELARYYGIPCVKQISNETTTIGELAEIVKPWPVDEGVIVRFDSGKMVKIKCLQYVILHRALDGLRFEKDVLEMIITNKLDDVLSIVDETMRNRLTDYSEYVLTNIQSYVSITTKNFESIRSKTTDKKEFAAIVSKLARTKDYFLMYDGKFDINASIIKNCSSQTTVESIRDIIGTKTFYQFN